MRALMLTTKRILPRIGGMIFEEFFWLAMALGIKRGERQTEPKGEIIEINERVRNAVKAILPFSPTNAQKRALKEIVDDMTSNAPMNRLLQGDVGSGKTIVGVQAMVIAVENGYQTALMAPTEILAEQHARNIRRIVENAGATYRVELLTGSLKAKEKREVQAAIAERRCRHCGRHARGDSGGRQLQKTRPRSD